MLPVAQAIGCVAYVPPWLCGDVYAPSEWHVCYTVRRGCSYAEGVYTTPGDWRQAREHLGATATCLGAPRITVMYSVCILIYVSMYLYCYPSTNTISGLAAVCRIYTPRHPVHLRYPCISVQPPSLLEDILDRACLRCTWSRRLSELRDALGGRDWASLEMHVEAVIERVWRYTWRPWLSEIGWVLGGGRWMACWDSIQQLVNSQPSECDKLTVPLKLLWRTGWWRSIGREVHRKLTLHSEVNSKSWQWRDDTQS